MRGMVIPIVLLALANSVSASPISGMLSVPGWVILEIDHGTTTRVQMTGHDFQGGIIGAQILNSVGAPVFGTNSGTNAIGALVSADTGPDDQPVEVRHAWGTTTPTVDLTMTRPAFAGYLLIWGAGNFDHADWTITLDGGGTANAIASGDSAIFSDGTGFDSDLHVIAQYVGYSATLQRNGRLPFDVEHNFVGLVGPRPADGESIRLETPEGLLECPCRFSGFVGVENAGSGTYSVLREATAAERGDAQVILGGVDVPWPPV